MTLLVDLVSGCLLLLGIFFFIAGIAALWRFPDTLCRLHAITKADNLGLGFIALGVALQVGWSILLLKILAIYLLILYGSALNGYLIAQNSHRRKLSKQARSG